MICILIPKKTVTTMAAKVMKMPVSPGVTPPMNVSTATAAETRSAR